MNDTKTFDTWKAAVDAAVERSIGLSVDDLPDCPFFDWFEDGYSAKAAASQAIRSAMEG